MEGERGLELESELKHGTRCAEGGRLCFGFGGSGLGVQI